MLSFICASIKETFKFYDVSELAICTTTIGFKNVLLVSTIFHNSVEKSKSSYRNTQNCSQLPLKTANQNWNCNMQRGLELRTESLNTK